MSAKLDPQTRRMFEAFLAKHKKVKLEPLSLAFDKQRDFIQDPARLKELFCTRRAAKSYTAGLYAFQVALDSPGCNVVLIGLTRESSKGIFWKDVLKDIDKRLGLGCKPNLSELSLTLPNGSFIFVTGIDASEEQMQKLLGRKYKLVVLDEGSTYSINLRSFVALMEPALTDQLGTLCMLGTSSNVTRGLFFDVSRGAEPGWSLHSWSAMDNPHMADNWAYNVACIETDRPEFLQSALFRQHFLNDWVIDESAKVYKYSPSKNLIRELPKLRLDGWQHVLGVDLGFDDQNSFSVLAFHEDDRRLFVKKVHKESGMDFTATAQFVEKLDKTYSFNYKVIDGANKQGVMEMNRRHGLSLFAADKTHKADFIRLMNDDFTQGVIQLLPDAQPVAEEYESLVWATDIAGKILEPRRENKNLPNHGCDSTLYGWRKCYQYLSEKPKAVPKAGTNEWADAEAERMLQHEIDIGEAEREQKDWGY